MSPAARARRVIPSYMINEVFLNKDFKLEEFLKKTMSAIEVIKNA